MEVAIMTKMGPNVIKIEDNHYESKIIMETKESNKLIANNESTQIIQKKSQFKKNNNHCSICLVSEWLNYWLESNIKIAVKKSTYYNYLGIIVRHINPELGDKALNELLHEDIQILVGQLMEKGLKASTLHGIFRLLNASLEKAVELEKLQKNPCRGVTLPKRRRKRPKSLTKSQQEILFNKAYHDKYGTAIIIAMFTGMRIGEISVLKWENINLEERIIYVKETILRVKAEKDDQKKTTILCNEPKSDSSNRVIPIPSGLLNYLIELKASAKSEYVVYCKDGKFAEPRVIQYRFKKLLKDSGLEVTNFHALRHTFATRSIESAADIASVSHLLGHSSVKMTLDYYADSTLEQRRKVMDYQDCIFQQMIA